MEPPNISGLEPTLINEAQATGYAKKYLDDSHHTQKTIDQNKKNIKSRLRHIP